MVCNIHAITLFGHFSFNLYDLRANMALSRMIQRSVVRCLTTLFDIEVTLCIVSNDGECDSICVE